MRTIVVLFTLLVSICYASWNPNTLPPFQGWINNPDGILDNATVISINASINTFMANVSMKCGSGMRPYQIAVVVVSQMDSGWTPEAFTKGTMDRFGVGYAPCNNGIVTFLSTLDRKYYTYVGAGVVDVMTLDAIDKISSGVVPYLKQSNWNVAMTTMVNGIINALRYPGSSGGSSGLNGGTIVAIIFGSFAVLGVFVLICSMFQNQRQKERLLKYRQDTYEAKLAKQKAFGKPEICSICLEEFPANLYQERVVDKPAADMEIVTDREELYYVDPQVAKDFGIMITECHHVFHLECVKKLHTKLCPICRRTIVIPKTKNDIKADIAVANWRDEHIRYARYRMDLYIYNPNHVFLSQAALIYAASSHGHRHHHHHNNDGGGFGGFSGGFGGFGGGISAGGHGGGGGF
jgi:uncharacterized membrane protein YgcG